MSESGKFSAGDFIALFCSIVIVIAFLFMPWVDFFGFSENGLNLLKDAQTDLEGDISVLWLIPLTASMGGAAAVWGILYEPARKITRVITLVAGVIGIIYFASVFVQNRDNPIDIADFVGIGFWVALMSSVGLALQTIIPRSVSRATTRTSQTNYIPLAIAYVTFIMLGMTASILNISWEYMRKTFALELSNLGIILAAGTIGYMIGAFINGRMLTYLGSVGKVLILGAGLTIIGLAGYVLSANWTMLLAVALIGSMGSGLVDAGLNTFLSANYGVVAMNWLHACFGIGATIAPLLVTFTVETLDQSWRTSYATLLVLEIAIIGLFLITLPQWSIRKQKQPDGEVDESPTDNPAGILATLRAPLVFLGMLLFILYGGVEIGTGQLANSLMTEGRGVAETTASYWVSIYWGSFTVGRMLSGFAAMRMSVRSLIRVSMIGIIVGAGLFWLNVGGNTGFIGLGILGFMQAPLFATITSDTPRRVGLRFAPNAIGFQLAMAGVGGTLVSGLAAWSADIFDNLEIIGFSITLTAVALFALYEWSVLREKQLGRPDPEDPRQKSKRKLTEA